MKYISVIAIAFCISSATVAQPTFTYNDFAPQAGDQYTVNNAQYLSPGNAGTFQTWNFSGAIQSGTATYSVTDVTSIPAGSQYPTATLGIGTGGYEMIQRTWNEYNCVGNTITPSMADFIYADPEKRFIFPMEFNDTYSDLFSGVSNATQTIYRSGFTLVSCDGFGTVITPTATYSNAVRIHRTVMWTDSSQTGSDTCTGDYYYWFAAGYRYPVAQIWSVTCTGGASTGAMFLQSITIGVEESLANSLSAFPSPFTSALTVTVADEAIGSSLEIHNVCGQIVLSVLITASEMKLNCEALRPGIYFVTCGNRNYRIVKSEDQ